ncbi:hypothetical protein ACFQ4C_18110 [Larkinella insperata]|uniref:Virion structural protein n=1 Tax=Larkinella insperata TaxID=332158 RepID=A0ABW3QBU0_9BACT|nr:hypothetical protein [Larkinella insperata]
MIQIRNQQGEYLHLSPGQRLTIEQASTLLIDDEKTPGSFSYPIRFPLDDHNQRFLGYAYRPDVLNVKMELPVQVNLQGHLYRRCTMRYRISDMVGDGYLVIDSGEVADRLKKTTLAELLPAEMPFGMNLPFVRQELGTWMQYYASQAPGLEPFTFFPIRADGFMDDIKEFNSEKMPGYVQRFYLNSFGRSGFRTDSPGNYGLHAVPQFYLVYILKQIMAGLGYQLEGDWIEDPETQRLVVMNNTAMVANIKTGAVYKVNPGLSVPEMTAGDFLKAVCQRFGLIVLYDANSSCARIRTFTSILKSNIVDLSTYQLQGYSVEGAEQQGYSVRDFIDEKDRLFANTRVTPKIVGTGKTDVQLRAGAPKMIREANEFINGGIWRTPYTGDPGNLLDIIYNGSSRYLKDGKRPNLPSLRFVSYRGMQPDFVGNLYPQALSDGLDSLLARVGPATEFDGQFGLWEQRLKRYYFFRNNSRKITANLLLPVSELSRLKLDERVGLRLESNILAGYLIQKLTFEAGSSSQVKVRLEMQTLPPLPESTDSLGYVEEETALWIRLEIQEGAATSVDTGSSTTTQTVAQIVVYFFKDRAATIPANVTGQPINFYIETTSQIGGYTSNVLTATVTGNGSAVAFKDVITYRHTTDNRSGEVLEDETVTYSLELGPGYNPLS